MKYRLINRKTSESHLCDKVTIDGFDYYVGDEIQLGANNVWVATKSRVFKFEIHMAVRKSNMPKIVIATNNPNIDIPKVVDEVEKLAIENSTNKIPTDIFPDAGEQRRWNFEGFVEGYNKSQQTHPFSEDDMIEFHFWLLSNCWLYHKKHSVFINDKSERKTEKELLQIWKEQRIKTLYYE